MSRKKSRFLAKLLAGSLILTSGILPPQSVLAEEITSDRKVSESVNEEREMIDETEQNIQTENSQSADILLEDTTEQSMADRTENQEDALYADAVEQEDVYLTESEEDDLTILTERAEDYDVALPHLIINQIYGSGTATEAPVSHSFIELYNPTETTVNLAGWSVQYRSGADGTQNTEWTKLDLKGSVPAKSSFLIRCNASTDSTNKLKIEKYDMSWDQTIHNKGVSVVLLKNTELLQPDSIVFDNQTKKPEVSGYVDMLSVSGDSVDTKPAQAAPVFEGTAPAFQTKNIAIRRRNFADTDDAMADTEAVNYKTITDVESVRPRSLADGEWVISSEEGMREKTLAKIEEQKSLIPKYYQEYCTAESVNSLDTILSGTDDGLLEKLSDEDLVALLESLTTAVSSLSYRSDETFPQIFITTDKGDGESYGTTLTKSIGYVASDVAVVYGGGILAVDDRNAQIKIRGNTTADGAKKPYNIKFDKKQDLFGFGKAKKWVLLADCYDPTLMRNEMALDLAEKLGLSSTPQHKKVEVWIDGKYNGLYLLTEKIEEDPYRIDIDSSKGDFMVEMDRTSRQEDGNIYLTTPVQKRFYRLRAPEDNVTEEQIETIRAVMGTFEEALSSGDYNDVKELMDEESFVAYYLLNEYMKSVDFSELSVYFYYKDGKLYAGPAWDYDLSTGNAGIAYGSGQNSLNRYDISRAATSHYFSCLMKYDEFRTLVYQKYQSAKKYFSEISADGGWIDLFMEKYSEGIERNYADGLWEVSKRYSTLTKDPGPTYKDNVAYLRDWCAHRAKWLESFIESPFADVTLDSWQYPYVKYVYDNGLMIGKGKGSYEKIIFAPNVSITRAEVVQVLYNKEGRPDVVYQDKFTDVPDGQWYTNAIIWASEKGIVAGKGERFDVSSPITRQEMTAVLRKYAQFISYDITATRDLNSYTDAAKISDWAKPGMQWAVAKGIMSGKGDHLDPLGFTTRAEAAAMLKSFIETYK